MILAALAAGAGIARGISGIVNAGKNGRRDRDTIKRAYQISKRRMNESQGYTRQGVTESLNARGILNAGSNTGNSAVVQDALKAKGVDPNAATKAAIANKSGVGAILKSLKGRDTRMADYEKARMAGDATTGQTGDASTLSGQVESDLSREFYGEHQDLFTQREQGINATKRQQSADVVNAIGSGIDVATQVYQGGKMIQGAFGAQAAPTGAPAAPAGQPIVRPGSWFGGYDPADPLGIAKRGRTQLNDQFNVKKG